ncbi:unnamed protein product, partial [Meganyctiphanes norvegica]
VVVLSVAYLVAKPLLHFASALPSELGEHFASGLPSELDEIQSGGLADYAFKYDVEDVSTGTSFGHEESQAGPYTIGSYHVLLPDGRRQKVIYGVHGNSGLISQISYENDNTFDGQGGVSHSSGVGYISKQFNTDRKIDSFRDLGRHTQLVNTPTDTETSENNELFGITNSKNGYDNQVSVEIDDASLNFGATPSTAISDISSLDGTYISSEEKYGPSTLFGTNISPSLTGITSFVSQSFDPPGSIGNIYINTHSTNTIHANKFQVGNFGGHTQLANTHIPENKDFFGIPNLKNEYDEHVNFEIDTSLLNFGVTPSTIISDISSLDGTNLSSEEDYAPSIQSDSPISPSLTGIDSFVSHSFNHPGTIDNTFIKTHSTNTIQENEHQGYGGSSRP